MQTTWILAADSSRARIFEELDEAHHLKEIEDFSNAAGHTQQMDLLEDEPERRNFGKGGRGGSIHDGEPETDPVTHENEIFSKEISKFLNKACRERRYDKLCVIAPPKFLGLLRQNLNKETRKAVEKEIVNDVSRFDEKEIELFVQNRIH
jgi:protein required for attachment to host cells